MTEENNEPEERSPSPPPAETPPSVKGPRKESIWEVYYPRNVLGETDAIPLASFPMIIYFWPSLLAMFFCGVLQRMGVDPNAMGWVGVGFLSFNLMAEVPKKKHNNRRTDSRKDQAR